MRFGSEFLQSIATGCLFTGPLLLVYIVGIVLSIVFWRKHPQLSMLTLIAFSIFAFSSLCNGLGQIYVTSSIRSGDLRVTDVSTFYLIWGILQTVAGIAAWVLLLIALFRVRGGQEQEVPRYE